MNNHHSVSETQPGSQPKSLPRACNGKIARLPAGVRDEINDRLYNGKSGSEILAWLNELPAVKEILATQFDNTPVSPANLSNWRVTGFQRWLKQQESLSSMKNTAKYAGDLAEAAGGSLCRGIVAFASEKILEFLQKTPENATPEELVKLATAAANLLKGEQNNVRLSLAHERLRQRERRLILIRDKQQRDVVAIARRILGDARARAIEDAPMDNAAKIELLGLKIYGELWEPRPIPTSEPLGATAN
jgi:hypothetical protein